MATAILLLNLIPGLLGNIPGISAKLKGLIGDITGGASILIGSGVLSKPSVNAALAAWLGIINLLKADPNLPQDKLATIGAIEKAIAAALTEDVEASKLVDWSSVSVAPITPVP